jgi:hypothetical protein
MAVDVFTTATGNDFRLQSQSTTYLTARSGSTLSLIEGAVNGYTGQYLDVSTYKPTELFLGFDTSSIPDANIIDSVVLSLYCQDIDRNDVAHYQEVWLDDWYPTPATTDWVAGADLSTATKLASLDTTGLTSGAYKNFTSEAAFAANINKTGITAIMVTDSRLRTGDAPTASTDTQILWYLAEQGAGYEPKLTVTHHASGLTGLTVTRLLNG